MKYNYFLFFLLLILSGNSLFAQEKDNSFFSDSLINYNSGQSGKADLELLARSVYKAFLIYTTDSPVVYSSNNLPIGSTDRNKYSSNKKNKNDGLPIILDTTNEEKGELILPIDSAKMKTPVEMIKSIEIIYAPDKVALYGIKGMPCIMKVKFNAN